MARKANVETVPGDFQKTQVQEPVLCVKHGIFASDRAVAGTGSRTGRATSTQGSLPTVRSYVFGYGSLIWRPSFPFVSRQRAVVAGFRRSFRQASSDHRGTPERPGRVATLISSAQHCTVGVVYELPQPATGILEELDHRERAGYERISMQVMLEDGTRACAVTWIAAPGNAYDAGELELGALIPLIASAQGPSGRNDEYVYRLEAALLELEGGDELVSQLSRGLRAHRAAGAEPLLASGPPDSNT
jgi:glutathione-specific gamma-glutamylcyclotransferase